MIKITIDRSELERDDKKGVATVTGQYFDDETHELVMERFVSVARPGRLQRILLRMTYDDKIYRAQRMLERELGDVAEKHEQESK